MDTDTGSVFRLDTHNGTAGDRGKAVKTEMVDDTDFCGDGDGFVARVKAMFRKLAICSSIDRVDLTPAENISLAYFLSLYSVATGSIDILDRTDASFFKVAGAGWYTKVI